jgi:hypothetical protein
MENNKKPSSIKPKVFKPFAAEGNDKNFSLKKFTPPKEKKTFDPNVLNSIPKQKNNPLHGVRLDTILEFLVQKYGWEVLGQKINIRCFNFDPSINSSLKFLRQTPWARTAVENLYLESL